MSAMSLRYFTSESVTSGHPDKLCDQLSDAILDAILEQDRSAKVAVECLASGGLIHVAGEVTTEGYVDIDRVVREVILDIGYDSAEVSFDGRTCGIMLSIARDQLGRRRWRRPRSRRPGHHVRLCEQRDSRAHARAYLPRPPTR
jgi:S-adenosylmethionine synthetase